MSGLTLYNTLTHQKEPFVPQDPAHVRVYACGPTVYNYAHIGNARMAVVFDQLVRVLRLLYPRVTYVSNITDVDDKIIKAAQESGEAIGMITARYENIYNEDMAALGAGRPDIQPRATEHIGDMIDLIKMLVEKGHAYEAEGHVMFHVPSYLAYGRLSGRSRDDQVAGARVEVAPYKKDPADFVLWKPSQGDQPGWDSPWGYGRPGWHIECSAMAERHFGLPFDIHGGGADLKFPHHENEIAQSCCAHGHETQITAFARYWVHNGFVTVNSEKMSKSLGNFAIVHDLLDRYDGEVLRLTLLSAHYRQPLDWSENAILQAKAYLDRLYRVLYDLADVPVPATAAGNELPAEIKDALCDDLNTPKALAALKQYGRQAAEHKDGATKAALLAAGSALGLLQHDPQQWLGFADDDQSLDTAQIEALLAERQEAKAQKNYSRADEIRDQLGAMGVVIEDTPAGPKWRRAG